MPSRSTSGGQSRTCDGCATSIAPGDRFCSGCGRPVESIDAGHTEDPPPSADDRAWLRRRVADLRVEGWKPVTDEGDRIVVRKRGLGRLPVHLVLLLVTGGAGNLLYALYRYTSGARLRAVYADGTEQTLAGGVGDGVDLATVVAAITAGLFVFVGVVWAVAALIAGLSGATAAIGAIVFLVSALVAIALPRFDRDRLESRGTFGTVHRVERERVRTPAEPCAACGRRVVCGERRRYAERFYVAGFPLRTTNAGENVYCVACADESDESDEPAGERADGESVRHRGDEPHQRDRAVER